jgi:hypothetical protein
MDVNKNAVAPNSQTAPQQNVISPVVEQPSTPGNNQPNLGAIRKAGQKEVLEALSKVTGQEFTKTKHVVKYLEQVAQGNTGGNAQPAKESKSKGNGEIAELRNMLHSLQGQLEQKDRSVRRATLQSEIKETAIRSGFDPDMLDIATNLFEANLDFDESGNPFVKGANGSVRLDDKGNPYNMEMLARDILRSRPKLAADEGRTGTGSRFSQGVARNSNEIPDASTDLEGWKKWKEQNGIGGRNLKGMTVSINKPIV